MGSHRREHKKPLDEWFGERVKVNNMISILRKVFALLLACMLLQSCASSPTSATSQGAATTENSNAAPGSQPTNATAPAPVSTDIPTPVPGPLDWLLALRSVKIEQSTTFPNGNTYSYVIEIDSTGNMRITENKPVVMYTGDLPKNTNIDISKFNGAETLYVIDGKAYEPDNFDLGWRTTPVDDDYVQTLSGILNGADGPGLWLDILTDDAFTTAGNENVGGFDTNKYNVNGQFNGQTISGTVWFEPKTDALIKAELTVPAALMNPSDQTGIYKITLDTQQTAIETVTLPDISAPTDAPTKTP